MLEEIITVLVMGDVSAFSSALDFLPSFSSADPPELQQAYDTASATLERDPGNVEARFTRGVVCQGKGWHQQAAADYVEVVRVQPEHPRAWLLLSEVLALLGQHDQSQAARQRHLTAAE